MLISGHTRGFHLVKSMHSKDALIKLLNLSINIRQQKIPEAEIQTFFLIMLAVNTTAFLIINLCSGMQKIK